MKYRRVFIEACGYELGNSVVTTAEIERAVAPALRRLGLSPGYVEAMTGIRERRYWGEAQSLLSGAIAAAEDALSRCDVPAQALGAMVYGSVCRLGYEPATICEVSRGLLDRGYPLSSDLFAADIGNACLGGLNGIVEIANRIELGQISAGLVVCSESAEEINVMEQQRLLASPDLATFRDVVATLTGGSGAAAIVLSDGSFGGTAHQLLGGVSRTNHAQSGLCRWGVDRELTFDDNGRPGYALVERMKTDAVGVLEHGVRLGVETWRAFLEEMQWSPKSIDKTVGHQVGRTHREKLLTTLELAPECDFTSFEELGNTGSVALPLTLALANEAGVLRSGDRVALMGIGSGLNCMMLGVQW